MIKKFVGKMKYWVLLCLTAPAMAALPKVDEAAGKSADGDYIGAARYFAKEGISVMGLVLCAVIFIMVVVQNMGKFRDCMAGKAPWSDLLGGAAISAVLLVACVWLLNASSSVL